MKTVTTSKSSNSIKQIKINRTVLKKTYRPQDTFHTAISRVYISPYNVFASSSTPTKVKLKNYTKLIENINTINSFQNLEPNWNYNDAQAISKAVVTKTIKIIKSLDLQPEVFPTGRNSIQIEFEKENGDYLEFEFFENSTFYLSIIGEDEQEFELKDNLKINTLVQKFYAK